MGQDACIKFAIGQRPQTDHLNLNSNFIKGYKYVCMGKMFIGLFYFICFPKTICLLFSLSLPIRYCFSQDSIPSLSEKRYKSVIYKADTLYFEKPGLVKIATSVPGNIWQLTKSPFKKEYRTGLVIVAASTALLVWQDQTALNWVRRQSDAIGLKPEVEYNILWAAGKTRIIKVPKNMNTALYQLGEGGTSLLLAGGLWFFGKIRKDQRLTASAADLSETFITMGVTTQILKRISGRESPFASTAYGGRWRPVPAFSTYQKHTPSYDAFPSGHLATMMASVTVLSYNFPEKKWIKPVGYTVMGLSAWAMMNTEVHWAGDYPLALAIGYLSGKITSMRHKKKPAQVSVINL